MSVKFKVDVVRRTSVSNSGGLATCSKSQFQSRILFSKNGFKCLYEQF